MTVLKPLGTFVLDKKTRTSRKWIEIDRIHLGLDGKTLVLEHEEGNHSVLTAILRESVAKPSVMSDYGALFFTRLARPTDLREHMRDMVNVQVTPVLKPKMAKYVMEQQEGILRCRLTFEWNVTSLPVKAQEWPFHFEAVCVDD